MRGASTRLAAPGDRAPVPRWRARWGGAGTRGAGRRIRATRAGVRTGFARDPAGVEARRSSIDETLWPGVGREWRVAAEVAVDASEFHQPDRAPVAVPAGTLTPTASSFSVLWGALAGRGTSRDRRTRGVRLLLARWGHPRGRLDARARGGDSSAAPSEDPGVGAPAEGTMSGR